MTAIEAAQAKRISNGAHLLYSYFTRAERAAPMGHAYFTIDELAEGIGSSRPCIIKYVKELEKEGLLEVHRSPSKPSGYKILC